MHTCKEIKIFIVSLLIYSLIIASVYSQNEKCQDKNCKYCNEETVNLCIVCKIGYRSNEGLCEKCSDPTCLNCSASKRYCSQCMEGKYRNSIIKFYIKMLEFVKLQQYLSQKNVIKIFVNSVLLKIASHV